MSSFNSTAGAEGAAAAAAAGAAGPEGAAGGGYPMLPPGVNPLEEMVKIIDYGFLGVISLVFLAYLPRTIGRFCNAFEWSRGFILRAGSPPPMVLNKEGLRHVNTTMTTLVDDYAPIKGKGKAPAYAYSDDKEWNAPSPGTPIKAPVHISKISTFLYPFSKPIAAPVTPTISAGKLLMMYIYTHAFIGIIMMKGGNPLADRGNRMAYIAISQLPFATVCAMKNNIIAMLLGSNYGRFISWHKVVSVTVFVMMNLHALGHLYQYSAAGKVMESIKERHIMFGVIALLSSHVLVSTSLMRKKAYSFFLVSHIVFVTTMFVGICFHQPVAIKWIVLSCIFYGADHVMRLVKTRIATANITALPELGMTRVEIHNIRGGWRAGQHVRLRVMSLEMGPLGWAFAHPFTIASASESINGHGLVLMCKKTGGWTSKLYALASRGDETGFEIGDGVQPSRPLRVIVEGPYGGVGNMVTSSYSSILLVAGGSGITFALSQAEELVQRVSAGKSSVKFIELVWVTQERDSLIPMLPMFSSLLDTIANTPGATMRINVHYTRAIKNASFSPDDSKKNVESGLEAHLATLAPKLTLHAGRPDFSKVMMAMTSLAGSVSKARGLAVCVCGPVGLVTGLNKAVGRINRKTRSACGGIEVHTEMFEL